MLDLLLKWTVRYWIVFRRGLKLWRKDGRNPIAYWRIAPKVLRIYDEYVANGHREVE
jgi:hypothetical protein